MLDTQKINMIIDAVLSHTFADVPRMRGGDLPDQPELGVDDLAALHKEIREIINI